MFGGELEEKKQLLSGRGTQTWSNTLTTPFIFQNLKRHFKVQCLNDSLFAIKINLKKT